MRKLAAVLPLTVLAFTACKDLSTDPTALLQVDGPDLARVAGAGFTTDNPAADDPRGCLHGNLASALPAVNCNLYNAKPNVWINGGPRQAGPSALTAGDYFFAILEPGGQGGNNNPNDGTPKNLSDDVAFSTAPNQGGGGLGDPYTNRMFRVGAGGDIIAFLGTPGTHRTSTAFQGTHGLMIAPHYFDDTRNPGGVYILAICRLGSTGGPYTYPVNPDDCKYDAFKVREGGVPPNSDLEAYIEIEADATNGIGEPHTFTVTMTAVAGQPPYSFTITRSLVSGSPSSVTDNCGTPVVAPAGNVATCEITVNSNAAGTIVMGASGSVTDSWTPTAGYVEVSTDGTGLNSGPATKTYVTATLSWLKRDQNGAALAGAVFMIERTHDRFGAAIVPSNPIITAIADCTVAPCAGADKDPAAGAFRVEGLPFGTWVITETAAPEDYLLDPAPKTVVISDLASPDGRASLPFVNTPRFSGETATGAGYSWATVTGGTSNWFMFTPWPERTFQSFAKLSGPFTISLDPSVLSTDDEVKLIAGQQYIAGAITATNGSGANRTITITLSTGMRFAKGVSNSVKIEPMASCTPSSYIQPGGFRVKVTPTAAQATAGAITVPAPSNATLRTAWNAAACYGIHVDVERDITVFP